MDKIKLMKNLSEIYTQRLEKDNVSIIPFSLTKEECVMENVRSIRDTGSSLFNIKPGNYVKLIIDNETVMSNTPMEIKTNQNFINNAKGDVLIAGLGLGLILFPLYEKESVKSIYVIEKNQSLIDLVYPYVKHKKLTILNENITELEIMTTSYDTIYFDIWSNYYLDREDDSEIWDEIDSLQESFKHCLRPNGFITNWLDQVLNCYEKSLRGRFVSC